MLFFFSPSFAITGLQQRCRMGGCRAWHYISSVPLRLLLLCLTTQNLPHLICLHLLPKPQLEGTRRERRWEPSPGAAPAEHSCPSDPDPTRAFGRSAASCTAAKRGDLSAPSCSQPFGNLPSRPKEANSLLSKHRPLESCSGSWEPAVKGGQQHLPVLSPASSRSRKPPGPRARRAHGVTCPPALPHPTHPGLLSPLVTPAAAVQLRVARDPRSGLVTALAALP